MRFPVAVLFVVGCAQCGGVGVGSGGGDPWAGGVTQLQGLAAFDSGLEKASVRLTSPYAGPSSTGGTTASASGQFTGAAMTGTFDPAGSQLSLTASAGYSVEARADSSGMVGTAESPTGPGAFAVAPEMSTVLCGSFSGSLSGSIGIVVGPTGRAFALYAISSAQNRGSLEGTATGGHLDFSSPISINGHDLTITGSVSSTEAHGTWSDTASTSGSWSAKICN
jgi:hypothetical protein